MSSSSSRPALRVAPLAACLSVALALGSTSSPLFAADRVVQNCGDGGPGSGSLRDMVGIANSGDTIDLSQLPTKCGMEHSTITLTNGEIVMSQQDLTLQGPNTNAGSVAIVLGPGSNPARVLSHTGSGSLSINGLTVANGNLQTGPDKAYGGCIKSSGNVSIADSIVTGCTAEGGSAFGGGIYVAGNLTLVASIVSGSNAIGDSYRGNGGGVYAGNGLTLKYSTLSSNKASTFGGGALAQNAFYSGAPTFIYNSTIDSNSSEQCAAGSFYTHAGVTISDSTISGNTASAETGGVCVSGDIAISNSTIGFNVGNGVAVWGDPSSLTLQSSIIAKNILVAGAYDLNSEFGTATIFGADNLIMTSNVDLQGIVTVSSDPKLGPLQFNGGRTRTRALLPGSPAIGSGNDTGGFATDQRGRGYPRTSGPSSSVDIGAFQFDSIFAHDFEW